MKPNSLTLELLVNHSLKLNSIEDSFLTLFRFNKDFFVSPNIETIINLIEKCCKLNLSTLAYDLAIHFEDSSPRALPLNVWLNILRCSSYNKHLNQIYHAFDVVYKSQPTLLDEGLCLLILNSLTLTNKSNWSTHSNLATKVLTSLKLNHVHFQDYHLSPLIQIYMNEKKIKESFEILSIMSNSRIEPNLHTTKPIFNHIKHSVDNVDDAYYILQDIQKEGGKVDIHSVNVIISACIHLNDMDRAVETYNECKAFNVNPNIETFNIILEGCISIANRKLGDMLLSELKNRNLKPNERTFERLIVLCLTQSNYEDCFFYLEEMKSLGYIPSANVYQTIIRKCHSVGDSRYRVAYDEMLECGYSIPKPLKSLLNVK